MQDAEAPPTYPVTVGVWETDDVDTKSHWRVLGARYGTCTDFDELRSPIKHHLVPHRRDPEQGVARFCLPLIERDLFGTIRLVRNRGRIGTQGQEPVEVFADGIKAGQGR